MKQNKDLGDAYDRCKLARGENTPAEILCELAKDENWNVRMGAAKNKNTPAEVLCRLAEDEEWFVRACVAYNRGAPVEVLCELTKRIWALFEPDERVRARVAENFNIPVEVLTELANDTDSAVRNAAQTALNRRSDASARDITQYRGER